MRSETPGQASHRRPLLLGIAALLLVGLALVWMLFRPPAFDRTKVYHIGFGNDAPLHFKGADGQPAGLAVELVKESARRQGIRLEWHNLREMAQNDIDLWVLRSIIPDLPSTQYLTEPYLQAESCFLVREDSPYRDLPDLVGARISFVDYRIHRETLPRVLASFQPVPQESSREAVQELLAGRSDAAYVDQYTLFTTIASSDGRALRILPTLSPTRDMALAARPASAAVADAIRHGMQSLVEDGTLEKLQQRWLFFPNITANIIGDIAQKQRRIRWLFTGLGAMSLLLAGTITLAVLAQRRKNEWRRSEQKYRELHESMTDAYVRYDLDGRVEDANPAFCELAGYAAAELPGLTDHDLLPPAWHDAEAERMRLQTLPRGHSDVHEKEIRRKDGTSFPVESRAFLLRNESGRPTGRWEIVRDITERKQAEAEREKLQLQLAQSQKMEVVGRLAGGVAHDFNNMLQAILGNTSLALLDLPASHPAHPSLLEVRAAAERSADLTRQLLAFARRQTVTPRVLELNERVESTFKLLRRLIGENVQLAWQPGAAIWPVFIDPSQVDQILTNLCVNARDAVERNGRVRLTTANVRLDQPFCANHPGLSPGDFVRLSISDDGHGMSPETQEHIFEPFFTTKEVGQGTGLGLATVYGIISQNHGCITVTSAPEAGTTFEVYLPRHVTPDPTDHAAMTTEVAPAQGHATILLVEDESAVLRVSQRILENLGYRVLAAASPDQALALAAQHPGKIDLLLTDVIMPGLNGRDLATRLLATHPGLKCVFMSGYDANVIAPTGVLPDDAHFLPKPFSASELAAKIRTALG